MSTDCIIFDEAAPTEVQAHPVAMFSILDHFLRRPAGASRVLGLLLGRASAGAMEVTSTIPVRHSMTGQSIDLQHDAMNKMIELMGEVDSTQALVGWYLVGGDSAAAGEGKGAEAASGGDREPLVNEASALLHDFFSSFDAMVDCPVHLTMDASMTSDALPVAAFVSLNEALASGGLALFEQVPVRVVSSDAERVAMDSLLSASRSGASSAMAAMSEAALDRRAVSGGKSAQEAGSVAAGDALGKVSGIPREVDMTGKAIGKLAALLAAAQAYVEDVASGAKPADPAVGTAIGEALAAVPRLPADVAARAVRGEVSDLALAGYLTSLTSAQLSLAERIASAVPLP